MSFASDKLYNGYLRRKMPTIVTKVKVREIVIHLPCLTAHDRENIEAKRETCGNYDGMVLLLECLRRRENWPEQFIEALEACEHWGIAAEIRAEYDALRGANNSSPKSPQANVVRAHVHPAPPAGAVCVSENGGSAQAAVTPPQPAAQASPPPARPPAQNPAARAPEAVSPPEPVPRPPQSAQVEVVAPPSTPPPSPETPHTPASTPPPPPLSPPQPQRELNTHQEPEENSEPDIQDASVDNGVIPDEVSVSAAEQCETDAPSHPDPLQTTAAAEAGPPQSPSPTQVNPDVTEGSSFVTRTPERPPVQDTAPPVDNITVAVLEPEETSEPPTVQVVESSPQMETAAATSSSPPPGAAGTDAPAFDDGTLCLSKPGQLISIQPQNHNSPTIPAHNPPAEPYSGDSQRLEFSESVHVPACSAVTSAGVSTVADLPCRENGIAPNHNEPEENHYESPCQSLETQEVLENVVHVSEEPSILNLDGQTSAPPAQIVNGDAAREISLPPPSSSSTITTTTAADTLSNSNTACGESLHPSEPAPELKTLPESEEKTASRTLPANAKYVLTAAGVGALALMMAWKFKN